MGLGEVGLPTMEVRVQEWSKEYLHRGLVAEEIVILFESNK